MIMQAPCPKFCAISHRLWRHAHSQQPFLRAPEPRSKPEMLAPYPCEPSGPVKTEDDATKTRVGPFPGLSLSNRIFLSSCRSLSSTNTCTNTGVHFMQIQLLALSWRTYTCNIYIYIYICISQTCGSVSLILLLLSSLGTKSKRGLVDFFPDLLGQVLICVFFLAWGK